MAPVHLDVLSNLCRIFFGLLRQLSVCEEASLDSPVVANNGVTFRLHKIVRLPLPTNSLGSDEGILSQLRIDHVHSRLCSLIAEQMGCRALLDYTSLRLACERTCCLLLLGRRLGDCSGRNHFFDRFGPRLRPVSRTLYPLRIL